MKRDGTKPAGDAPVPLPFAVDVRELRGEVVAVGAGAEDRLQLAVAQHVAERDAEARAETPPNPAAVVAPMNGGITDSSRSRSS